MKKVTKPSSKTIQTAPLQSRPESLPSEEDEIRTRAHELFLERNCEPGHADDDWLRAESEIRNRGKAVSPESESSR